MEEDKTFLGMSNGDIHITIKKTQKLTLPGDIVLGDFNEETTQLVHKDKVHHLVDFIKKQLDDAFKQRDGLEKNLKQVEHVNVDLIEPKLLAEIAKSVDKGSKAMKAKLNHLNTYLEQAGKKKQSMQQLSYMTDQIETMERDLKELKKAKKSK